MLVVLVVVLVVVDVLVVVELVVVDEVVVLGEVVETTSEVTAVLAAGSASTLAVELPAHEAAATDISPITSAGVYRTWRR